MHLYWLNRASASSGGRFSCRRYIFDVADDKRTSLLYMSKAWREYSAIFLFKLEEAEVADDVCERREENIVCYWRYFSK